MKNDIFLIDFDGTITINDTTKCLAETVIPEMHKKYVKLFREKKINVRMFVKDLLCSLNISENEFRQIIKEKVVIDSTFKNFFNSKLQFYILSSGTQLNILSALEKIKIQLDEKKIIANKITFKGNNITIDSPYYDEINGINKSFVVNKFKAQGNRVIFVGDGPSDYEGCKFADVIFARKNSKLEKKLKEEKVKFYTFKDFDDLLGIYKKHIL